MTESDDEMKNMRDIIDQKVSYIPELTELYYTYRFFRPFIHPKIERRGG